MNSDSFTIDKRSLSAATMIASARFPDVLVIAYKFSLNLLCDTILRKNRKNSEKGKPECMEDDGSITHLAATGPRLVLPDHQQLHQLYLFAKQQIYERFWTKGNLLSLCLTQYWCLISSRAVVYLLSSKSYSKCNWWLLDHADFGLRISTVTWGRANWWRISKQ